jgi:glycosyltransferase involved in cell wall biosynthesis
VCLTARERFIGGIGPGSKTINPCVNPTVTICIPTYQYAHYLAEAVESALAQTYPCEVIILDDGSTDTTAEVAARYPQARYIYQENKGLAAARNAAIREATGEVILCLDSDDKLHPKCVERCVRYFSRFDIVVPGQQEFEGGSMFYARAHNMRKMTLKGFLTEINFIHCASMFKKSDWMRVGGYDESDIMRLGLEDAEFWWRMVGAGCTIGCIDLPLFFYRIHKPGSGKSMTARTTAPNRNKILKYMRKKNHHLYEQAGLITKMDGWL